MTGQEFAEYLGTVQDDLLGTGNTSSIDQILSLARLDVEGFNEFMLRCCPLLVRLMSVQPIYEELLTFANLFVAIGAVAERNNLK